MPVFSAMEWFLKFPFYFILFRIVYEESAIKGGHGIIAHFTTRCRHSNLHGCLVAISRLDLSLQALTFQLILNKCVMQPETAQRQ